MTSKASVLVNAFEHSNIKTHTILWLRKNEKYIKNSIPSMIQMKQVLQVLFINIVVLFDAECII